MTIQKQDLEQVWNRIESLGLLGLTGIVGVAGMMGLILLGSIVGTHFSSITLVYAFSVTGISFFLVILAMQALHIYRGPRRIGHGLSSLFLERGIGEIKEIAFREIESVQLSKYPSGWYVELTIKDGERLALGPGITKGFGQSLLHTYVEWLGVNTRRIAEVQERKGLYPSKRVVLSSK